MTYIISDFSKRIRNINGAFKRNAFEPQLLMDNPLNLIEEFEKLQKNQYNEMSRVSDFLALLEEMGIPYGQVRKEFKDRQNFGAQTMGFLKQNVFNPANLPPREMTSILPRLVEKLNTAYSAEIAAGKREPFTLNDIYPVQELRNIMKKWMRVPLGLSDQELDEYFMGGKKLPIDKTSMILPDISPPKQVTKLTPDNVPLNTPSVSGEVIKSQPINVAQSGLTRTEEALLSNEEKAIKLRSKGITA